MRQPGLDSDTLHAGAEIVEVSATAVGRTNYERGRASEYAARQRLLDDGYHTVIRAAGSHSPADLIAVGEQHIKFVQVKRMAELRSYEHELEQLRAWPVPEGCAVELWIHDVEARRWIVLPA